MAKTFRVAHARIDLKGFWGAGGDDQYRAALEQSWVAGEEVSRYGRNWRISRHVEMDQGFWSGHIGYVEGDAFSTLAWNEQTKEFDRGEASGGVVIPFVVNLPQRMVSFQYATRDVKLHTVTGNLQALLNQQSTYDWEVAPLSLKRTFEDWHSSVTSIATLTVLLRRPNPNWEDREKIADLLDELQAESVRMTARASEGVSINADSSWFTQMMDHVRRGYGQVTMTGVNQESGAPTKFIQTADAGAVEATESVRVEGDAVELSSDELAQTQRTFVERGEGIVVESEFDEETDDQPDR